MPVPKTASQRIADITGKTPKKITLLDNSVCCRVKLSKFGTQRKVSNDAVEVDADLALINVSKKLLDSPEMTAIVKFDGETKGWIYAHCLKSFLDEGMYFVSLNTEMKRRALQRAVLVENLCDAYEQIREKDRQRLRATFRDTDYVRVERLREAFRMSWQYLALTAPKSLEAVSEDLYKEAEAKINAEIADATVAVRYALREEMKKLTDWAIDRLQPDTNGKKKIFRSKSKDGKEIGFTAKFNEFLACFQGRNITEDIELQQLVEKARAVLAGVDGEALRNSEAQRESVRTGFESIKSTLDTLVADDPIRQITVD
jgi:hypothetical protein